MKKIATITLLYALIILLGGWIGHIKAASAASLWTGVVSGILLLISAYLSFKKNRFGPLSAILLTLMLDAFFVYRFALTGKWMPPGLLSLLSLAVLFTIVFLLRKEKPART